MLPASLRQVLGGTLYGVLGGIRLYSLLPSMLDEVPTMMTTVVTARAAMPDLGVDVLPYILSGISRFQSNEKRSCANAVSSSEPLKGLILSDRNLSGRHFHANYAIMTRENCCHDGSPFLPRNPVFWGSSRIFCHICVPVCSMGARNPVTTYKTY